MKETETGLTVPAEQRPGTELVAHHAADLAPVSLSDVAERLAGAVQAMKPDDVYVDLAITKNGDSTSAKFSFRAYRRRSGNG